MQRFGEEARRLTVVIGVLVVQAALAAAAVAGTGEAITLPAPATKKSPTGLTLTLDPYWVQGCGYRPVRVRVTTPTPSAAERTITIRLHAFGWRAEHGSVRVIQDLELPAGGASAQTTLALPEYAIWNQFSWDVWVDGAYAEELSLPAFRPMVAYYGRRAVVEPLILVVGRGSAGLDQLRQLLTATAPQALTLRSRPSLRNSSQGGGQLLALDAKSVGVTPPAGGRVAGSPSLAIRDPKDLPTRWTDYSGLDIVYLSADELAGLVDKQPQAWQAVRQWLGLGGNLWVTDVGSEWQRLADVERALDIANEVGATDPTERGWRPTPPPKRGKLQLTPPLYVWREHQLGQVLALAEAKPFSQATPDLFRQVVKLQGSERTHWTRRHGLSPVRPMRDFWSFLIPGVGLAPVTAFQVLITLFVVVIGPLNYFLLLRLRRLQWLLVTVPVGAALVTGALFAFAILSDGLGTRVRVRSYTRLDQRHGEAVSWARQSYYAGLAPYGGLELPNDTLILPLLPGHDRRRNFRGARGKTNLPDREIEWGEAQHLTSGWLKSRTPAQYLMLRACKSGRKLSVGTNGGQVQVENRLRVRIEQLVVVDEQGGYHWGKGIEAGDKAALVPTKLIDAATQMRKVHAAATPQSASIVRWQEQRRSSARFNRRYYYDDSDEVPIRYRDSRLEQAIADVLAGKSSADGPYQARSYVAIVDRGPEVVHGVEGVQEEASFHVVVGQW